ncbi:antitoxin VbhA family protein [Leucobacter sp. HY1910]
MSAQDQRETLVNQTVHSAMLEGLNVSSAFREDSDKYVAGVISADELVELTRERFGLAANT